LPFAIWPLIRLTSDPAVMGRYANGLLTRVLAWSLFGLISIANIWLMARLLGGQ
jgi:manganese transport protein